MNKTTIIALALIIASIIAAFYFNSILPEKIAIHWGLNGEANGFASKEFGLFFIPVLLIGLFLLLKFIPRIDPLKQNIAQFRKHYDLFILVIIAFLFYVFILSLLWNLGIMFNFSQLLIPAFALLMFFLGILLENAKQNWFIGIRTPWTMSSENVWNKTHKLGARMFKQAAIISLIGLIFPDFGIAYIIAVLIAITICLFVFSYFEFKKEKK